MNHINESFIRSKENIDNINNIIKNIRTKEFIKKQNETKNVFKNTIDVLNKNNIPWWASYGTLIGALRHGGFVPWDDDVDICMHYEYLEKLLSINWSDYELYYKIVFKFKTMTCLKIFSKKHDEYKDRSMVPAIDIFATISNLEKIKDHDYVRNNFLLKEDIFPLKKIKFENFEIFIPNNYKNFLHKKYFGQDVLKICNIWNHQFNDWFSKDFDKNKYQIFIEDLIIEK